MIYGYARVSTMNQQRYGNSLEAQEAALLENGATVVYKEAYTGKKKHRPQLDKLLAELKDGDVLMVTKLDRVARSAANGIEIADSLIERGVALHVLNIGKMDNTPAGKLIRNIFFAFAEFERDMIVERTSEGRAIARENPEYREGRKPVMFSLDLYDKLSALANSGEITVSEAAKKLGVSRAKWYRIAKEKAASSGGAENTANTLTAS